MHSRTLRSFANKQKEGIKKTSESCIAGREHGNSFLWIRPRMRAHFAGEENRKKGIVALYARALCVVEAFVNGSQYTQRGNVL